MFRSTILFPWYRKIKASRNGAEMFSYLSLGSQGLNQREIWPCGKSFPNMFSFMRRWRPLRLEFSSSFCIKCIEIIKQFREPAQETASGAVALLIGPASHNRVCSLGRKIVPLHSPQQFRSLQDPSGYCRENYGQCGAEYTTHSCLMLSSLRKIQLIKA